MIECASVSFLEFLALPDVLILELILNFGCAVYFALSYHAFRYASGQTHRRPLASLDPVSLEVWDEVRLTFERKFWRTSYAAPIAILPLFAGLLGGIPVALSVLGSGRQILSGNLWLLAGPGALFLTVVFGTKIVAFGDELTNAGREMITKSIEAEEWRQKFFSQRRIANFYHHRLDDPDQYDDDPEISSLMREIYGESFD